MDEILNNQDIGHCAEVSILRALVIDSDLRHRKLLGALVGRIGGEAIEARHGLEGLEKIGQLRPNMVITSLRTENLSGIELIKEIQGNSTESPYILVSIHADEEIDQEAAIEGGADDWIVKPFRQAAVLSRLRIGQRVIHLRSRNRSLVHQIQRFSENLNSLNNQLHQLSLTDDLTGLPNWSFAQRHLEDLWSKTHDGSGPLACLMVDLDGFKKINNSLGREQGDSFLKSVAAALAATVSPQDVVCRFGGDRFVVICPDRTLLGAMAVGEALLKRVGNPGMDVDGIQLGISVGAAERRVEVASPAALLYVAERGMYRAKFNGRNRVVSGHSSPVSQERQAQAG